MQPSKKRVVEKIHHFWVAGLLGLSGCCYSGGPFIREPLPEYSLITQKIPQDSKTQLAIFFVQDGDLLDCDGFRELNAQVRACGYRQTYFGYLHHSGHFAKEIQRLHEQSPATRFVLAGHGLGAAGTKIIQQKIHPIPVELVFLMDSPDWLIEENQMENSGKLISLPEVHTHKVTHESHGEVFSKHTKVKKRLTPTEEGTFFLNEISLLATGIEIPNKTKKIGKETRDWNFLEETKVPKEIPVSVEPKKYFEKKEKVTPK